jgi:cysteine desulfurase
MRRIYFDHNATTPLDAEAQRAMVEAPWGNASSRHAEGRLAREALERARDRIAALMGATRDEIVLTSGATEANRIAIVGAAVAMRAKDARRVRVIASPLEHPSVLGAIETLTARGFTVDKLTVDVRGRIDPESLRADETVAIVTVQSANHELGNLNPIAELRDRARAAGALFHTDAVQLAGKGLLSDADLVSISAHKLYGPKGIGALRVRAGVPLVAEAGGHQERGLRAGTESVAAAVGFGVAAERARSDDPARIRALRDRFEAGAIALGAEVNGDRERRVGNTSNVAWPGAEGALMMESLDLAGVSVSTGAACTSGSLSPSPVLLALGQDRARAACALRFSFGRDNTDDEVDRVLALLPAIIARVRTA